MIESAALEGAMHPVAGLEPKLAGIVAVAAARADPAVF
jgi:hypothetical protein